MANVVSGRCLRPWPLCTPELCLPQVALEATVMMALFGAGRATVRKPQAWGKPGGASSRMWAALTLPQDGEFDHC